MAGDLSKMNSWEPGWRCAPGVLLLWLVIGIPAYASQPFLVKDIHPSGSSLLPLRDVELNGRLFFNADDGVHGQELWVSDGTASGTRMLKDIVPGPDGGVPQLPVTVNGLVFFWADDNIHGAEMWVTDGTTAGTNLVKDIDPSTEGNTPGLCGVALPTGAAVDGTFFFVADDGVRGREVWKSDGTEEGTMILRDIYPGGGSPFPGSLTSVGGTLFFRGSWAPLSDGLWKSDGTEEGTVYLKQVYPIWTADMKGIAFFQGDDDVSGTGDELWKSDGTPEGTVLVKDIYPGSIGSRPAGFTNVNGTVFFGAYGVGIGRELWKTDGTEEGTVMVADIKPGPGLSMGVGQAKLTLAGEHLFFHASDGETGLELWALDVVEPLDKIPTVSVWGITVLTLLLLTAGSIIITGRRRTASRA